MDNSDKKEAKLIEDLEYQVSKTRGLPYQTEYTTALLGSYPNNAYDEEKVLNYKGCWRKKAFSEADTAFLDLEIGTGNGFHFAHLVKSNPKRCLVGFELKYKPLIQTVRRSIDFENKKFVVARYDARMLKDIFSAGELNNVYIHFPDPWGKDRQKKHRLLKRGFFNLMYSFQRENSFLEFKTDHPEYFAFVTEEIKHSPYKLTRYTKDLHNSEWEMKIFKHTLKNFGPLKV